MTDKQSWTDRLFGGFRKTSEKLTSNLTEVVGNVLPHHRHIGKKGWQFSSQGCSSSL